MAGSGVFSLGLKNHDILSFANFHINDIITNQYFALSTYALLFVSIILFILVLKSNWEYLNPHKFLLLSYQGIDLQEIRGFVLKEKGIPDPKMEALVYTTSIIYISKEGEKKKDSAETERRAKNKYASIMSHKEDFLQLKDKVQSFDNPFISINEIAIQSIKILDLKTFSEILNIYSKISLSFINEIKYDRRKSWDPNKEIDSKYIDVLCDNLLNLYDVCSQQNFTYGMSKIIDQLKELSIALVKNQKPEGLSYIFLLIRNIGDNSIGKSRTNFIKCINYYQETGLELISSNTDNSPNTSILDDVFRNLGWLGEKLIQNLAIEKKPLMWNSNYETEHDALLNSLYSFSDKILEIQKDPMIYTDAIYVTIKTIAEKYSNNTNYKWVGQNIISLFSEVYWYGNKSIESRNSEGITRSLWNLYDIYTILDKNEWIDESKEAIRYITRLTIKTISLKEELKSAHYMDSFRDWFNKKITPLYASELAFYIADEIRESLVKLEDAKFTDYDKKIAFIKELGVELGTNFNLNFDPATGENYQK